MKKNYYAKENIFRVMSWGGYYYDSEFKFEQLKHYFELYFRLKSITTKEV
jgi:hypothetical protein